MGQAPPARNAARAVESHRRPEHFHRERKCSGFLREQFHPSRLVGVSQAHLNAGQPEDRSAIRVRLALL